MTTSPVTSVTDELIAELERLAIPATKGNWCTDGAAWVCAKDSDQLNNGFVLAICEGPDERKNSAYMAKANPATILALLAEREELKRDAARYRWLRDTGPRLVIECPLIAMCNSDGSVVRRDHGSEMLLSGDSADAAIDAAMQS